jgi:hypothetical protein
MKRHKEIQQLAHELFEKSGRVHGREIGHWLEAECIVSAREASSRKQAVPRSDIRSREPKKTGRPKKNS